MRILQICLFFYLLAISTANASTQLEKITIGLSLQPTSLNPQHKEDLLANHVMTMLVFNKLYSITENNRIERELIEKEVVENPNSWLFTLKPNILFHDGNELTTDDVIATFKRLASQDDDNNFKKMVDDKLKIEKVDKYRFRIKTQEAIPDLKSRLRYFPIISKNHIDASEEDFNSGKSLIGTGPYKLVKHENFNSFEYIKFEKHQNHKKNKSAMPFKKLSFKVILKKKDRIKAFQKGELHLIDDISPAQD